MVFQYLSRKREVKRFIKENPNEIVFHFSISPNIENDEYCMVRVAKYLNNNGFNTKVICDRDLTFLRVERL